MPDIEVLGLDDVEPYDEPAETEPTFEGNALIKARAGVEATGLPSLADDSGLCVDALNGMPGVLSARWAGTAKDDAANNRLLLDQLADVPDERRGAHFTCAVAFAYPVGAGGVVEHVVHGEMAGRVIREQRGEGGFGYDVLFVADDTSRRATTTPRPSCRPTTRTPSPTAARRCGPSPPSSPTSSPVSDAERPRSPPGSRRVAGELASRSAGASDRDDDLAGVWPSPRARGRRRPGRA